MAKQYEINEKDIDSVLRFLKISDPENATTENAINFLRTMQAAVHKLGHGDQEELLRLYQKFNRKNEDDMAELKSQLKVAKSAMPTEIVEAHTHCGSHKEEVMESKLCGCFFCLETFEPSEIEEWVDRGKTAICPKCGIDAVLGDASRFPLTREFLSEMHHYWFEA